MPEINEEIKFFKEFEKNFGFEAYEKIKKIMSRLYMKIEELEKSREEWKKKYNELKKS